MAYTSAAQLGQYTGNALEQTLPFSVGNPIPWFQVVPATFSLGSVIAINSLTMSLFEMISIKFANHHRNKINLASNTVGVLVGVYIGTIMRASIFQSIAAVALGILVNHLSELARENQQPETGKV